MNKPGVIKYSVEPYEDVLKVIITEQTYIRDEFIDVSLYYEDRKVKLTSHTFPSNDIDDDIIYVRGLDETQHHRPIKLSIKEYFLFIGLVNKYHEQEQKRYEDKKESKPTFEEELENLIDKYSKENHDFLCKGDKNNIPDDFLIDMIMLNLKSYKALKGNII